MDPGTDQDQDQEAIKTDEQEQVEAQAPQIEVEDEEHTASKPKILDSPCTSCNTFERPEKHEDNYPIANDDQQRQDLSTHEMK
ncbi:unnamed protein product, partial [Amoebophrya sp. A25]|eukprot:GSA25T00018371001.1